ncbi:MAG: hypothetical protein Q9214_001157, partial [Letrouitia sp. 1 TL-2023]
DGEEDPDRGRKARGSEGVLGGAAKKPTMSSDRSLATLLRTLQTASQREEISRLLASATTLLTLLTNPLNVTLLTSQLVIAPAIWRRPENLQSAIRVFAIFNTASIHLLQRSNAPRTLEQPQLEHGLSIEDWTVAVIKGADERSPRSRHVLVLCGLLLGFEGQQRQGLSSALRKKLESAVVTAINLSLQDAHQANSAIDQSVIIALCQVIDLLEPVERMRLNYDLLLPVLIWAPFFSPEGLYKGYFLSAIDFDVVEGVGKKFDWSSKSTSYVQLQKLATSPLITSLGSLSRLAATSIENIRVIKPLTGILQDLFEFSRSLCLQWRHNKLCEIDMTEETAFLTEETLRTPTPLLWRVLRSTMFAIVIVLRSYMGRILSDSGVGRKEAPAVAVQTLQILRNLYFISSRLGSSAFSEYSFIYLCAVDILAQYPIQAEAFLRDIRPSDPDKVPQHPLDRCHGLFFLNAAEHFAIVLEPRTNEELLITAARPYLGIGGDQRLLEIFEAAHSAVLAVFAAPQNSDLVARHIYYYVDVLFQVFPSVISPRQFRIAIKTLVRVTSPPTYISASQPLLSSTILELVRSRSESASADPLLNTLTPEQGTDSVVPLSEQATLVMALVDSLPFVPTDVLDFWLSRVAEALNNVQQLEMLYDCQKRLWNIFNNGEMGAEKAALCHAWWSTNGGKEMVFFDGHTADSGSYMNGVSQESSKL